MHRFGAIAITLISIKPTKNSTKFARQKPVLARKGYLPGFLETGNTVFRNSSEKTGMFESTLVSINQFFPKPGVCASK